MATLKGCAKGKDLCETAMRKDIATTQGGHKTPAGTNQLPARLTAKARQAC